MVYTLLESSPQGLVRVRIISVGKQQSKSCSTVDQVVSPVCFSFEFGHSLQPPTSVQHTKRFKNKVVPMMIFSEYEDGDDGGNWYKTCAAVLGGVNGWPSRLCVLNCRKLG